MDSFDTDRIAREIDLPFARDDDRPVDAPVTATPEEIRYADTLRQRLREFYTRHAEPVAVPWCLGAD